MAHPALVVIDDDQDALRDIERELRERYDSHYRVICVRSPQEARASLEELAAAGEDVALVLAGQWLSGTTGSELLEEARRLHPHAKRGLVIAWGDLGGQRDGRGDLRLDRTGRDRPLRAAAVRSARRALSQRDLGPAARVDRVAAHLSVHDPCGRPSRGPAGRTS